MVSTLLIALLVAVACGTAVTAYVWKVLRYRLETAAGMRIVAGMRWREFSQLVVDSLRERGFEAESEKDTADRGQQTDLVLHRDGKPWLLACKQGEHYRITPAVLAEFSKAVRLNGASGGLMVTPGSATADARRQAGAIELVDGVALWPMLQPLLPASVRNSVAAESHALCVRYVLLGWLAALVLGVGLARMMPTSFGPQGPQGQVATGVRPTTSEAITDSAAPAMATAPLTEEEQREQVRREVSDLPGIDRALWSSRSTLIVYLAEDSASDHLRSICTVMERYDDLRASRLQLQPTPDSQRAVRFLQCRVF